MIPLPIAGWSVLCSCGIGKAILADSVRRHLDGERIRTPDVTNMYAQPLPSTTAHAMVDFNVRDLLGRKGTSSLDRRSALAVVACGQAIAASDIRVDDTNRHRIGIILGTSLGSLKSMNDYTQETLLHDRPYLVEPLLFPNTVMNCAAGQAAIRYGLKGVNATVAGCELAFLHALRYSSNALRCEYADALLIGAVEEFTPHTAWATHLLSKGSSKALTGEGAAVFVTRRHSATADRTPDGEILSVVTGYSPSGDGAAGVSKALAHSIRRAVHDADVAPRDVTFVATSWNGSDENEQVEAQALTSVFGSTEVQRIHVKEFLGECGAATGALQLATLLALHHNSPALDERVSVLCGWLPDGGVGAAVFRGRKSCRP